MSHTKDPQRESLLLIHTHPTRSHSYSHNTTTSLLPLLLVVPTLSLYLSPPTLYLWNCVFPLHATMTSTPPRTATTSKARRQSHVRVDTPCPSLCAAPGCRFSARTMHDMAAHHARSHGGAKTHSHSVPLLRRASKHGSRDSPRQRQEKRKRTRTPRRHEPHAVRADMVSVGAVHVQGVRDKNTRLMLWCISARQVLPGW